MGSERIAGTGQNASPALNDLITTTPTTIPGMRLAGIGIIAAIRV